MERVSVFCGGSGSSKFVLAIQRYLEHSPERRDEFEFIANVGDNFWHYGLYICPDVDILTYALAGILDESKGWGVASDTFAAHDTLRTLSPESSWFNLGDRDLALSVRRTELLKNGLKLSEITDELRRIFGIKYKIIPASDDPIETHVTTEAGAMHLQEFWVKNRASIRPLGVAYLGIEKARPNPSLLSLGSSVVLCPANPITSILPSVNLAGVRDALKLSKVITVSPFVGGKPFSGPAGFLMNALGMEPTSYGLANLYSEFSKMIIVDENEDQEIVKKIKAIGIECISRNTRITGIVDQLSFGKDLLDLI
ncbi:MAG: 2-phospho-L-lactate transferase [Nitrososphaerales archaeon]